MGKLANVQVQTSCTSLSQDLIPQYSSEIITLQTILNNIPREKQCAKSYKHKHIYKSLNSDIIKCCKWTKVQTNSFYELLSVYGTDFSLMTHDPIFINKRSKKQLLNKYKKQSKINCKKIDQVLFTKTSQCMFNMRSNVQTEDLKDSMILQSNNNINLNN